MPIYAYRCPDCGFEKDQLQKISDAPLSECPSCGGQGFARILTAPAFQLKGSGWYVTDFRDQGKGRKPGEADTSKSAGEADSSGSGGAASASASSEGSSGASAAPSTPAGSGTSASASPAASTSKPSAASS